MKTNHIEKVNLKNNFEKPKLFKMTPDHLVKAKFSEGERMCMTGWMLHLFLDSDKPYVDAYKEFRCKMMDHMYRHFSEDHANTAEQRANLWNMTAESLNYNIDEREQ